MARPFNRKIWAMLLAAALIGLAFTAWYRTEQVPAAPVRIELPICSPDTARKAGVEHADTLLALVRAPATRPQGCAQYARQVTGSVPWVGLFPRPPACEWSRLDEASAPPSHAIARMAEFSSEIHRLCGALDLGGVPAPGGLTPLDMLSPEDREALDQYWTGTAPPEETVLDALPPVIGPSNAM